MPLTLTNLVQTAHETARAKGWHDALTLTFLKEALDATASLEKADAIIPEAERESYDGPSSEQIEAMILDYKAKLFGAQMALIGSELSEALEAYRERGLDAWTEANGKPCGVASEIADVVIRVGDLCGLLGINLEAAVEAKLAYNLTRSHRHGGKAL